MVDTSASDAELKRMNDLGVRGIRFNLAQAGATTPEMIEALSKRVNDLGWHIQINAPAAKIMEIMPILERVPSPIVELNRAVAIGMAFGPAAALNLVDALTAEPSLRNYHLLPSVRGDLLCKLRRFDEARAEFEHAAALTRNTRERDLLLERARTCASN